MLEVKNLKKVYKQKNGVPVFALNNVSLKFAQTGLVFILGKSGSGKSTLLNVMGGLDVADEGEIIIDGKSSKDFVKNEMDSYRNSYLGFIFQEYNILQDFTIKDNIALALELQNIKATDEKIASILKEVDLSGIEQRKPNELSGGQKQRVAIARALIKEPKIIFADEPTGALDSNTGNQVFETLKKLSKDKLVIVVSHDREFAEKFGDRVIELKDGKVISDITKQVIKNQESSNNLTLVEDHTIRISKNRPLTADDLEFINKTLLSSSNDIFITSNPKINEAICDVAKINQNGDLEEFSETDPSKIQSINGTFKPIKSSFSFIRAFKMGWKALKVKKFRLILTIILSIQSFVFFGLSATLGMFSERSAIYSSITKNDSSFIVGISYSDNSSYNNHQNYELTYKEIEEKTNTKIYPLYCISLNLNIPSLNSYSDSYHIDRLNGLINIDQNYLNETGYQLVAGRLPDNANEICIPEYAYHSFKDLGFGEKNTSDYIKPDDVTYEKIIGTKLNSTFTITGIIDTHLPSRMEAKRYSEDSNYYYRSISVHSLGMTKNFTDNKEDLYTAVVTFNNNKSTLNKFLDIYEVQKKAYQSALENNLSEETWMLYFSDSLYIVSECATLLMLLTKIFVSFGVIFAIISILLFYNFMSISINNKKHEIGILRAVGAKKADVFKIFLFESFIIASINFVFSVLLTFVISSCINSSVINLSYETLLVSFDIMSPNILIVLLLLAISLLSSLISSYLPVLKIANKKPIDAINNK